MSAAAELRRLLSEATPGPWMGGTYMDENQRTWFDISVDPGDFGVANGLGDADAALIVWLVNHADALADLIDAADRLQLGLALPNAPVEKYAEEVRATLADVQARKDAEERERNTFDRLEAVLADRDAYKAALERLMEAVEAYKTAFSLRTPDPTRSDALNFVARERALNLGEAALIRAREALAAHTPGDGDA